MLANQIDFMKEDVCLNFIDSIQELIPIVEELNAMATVKNPDISTTLMRYSTKLRGAQINIEGYFNLVISIMDDVVIHNIRTEIANSIAVINKNATPVSLESCFMTSDSYVYKTNKKIVHFNNSHVDVAIEEAFIVNPSSDEWYNITINGDNGILIEKTPMAAISPTDVIEHKLPELLEIADKFVIYLEHYRNDLMDRYFSSAMIKMADMIYRGEVNKDEIYGIIPNKAELEKVYTDIMMINATINAFYVNTTTANTLINTQLYDSRLRSF